MYYYILAEDGMTPVKTDMMGQTLWSRTHSNVIRQDFIGQVKVSTIFLPFDHASYLADILGEPGIRPTLWETMIFGGEHDGYQDRYQSHQAAIEGHAVAVDMVKRLLDAEQAAALEKHKRDNPGPYSPPSTKRKILL